MTDYTELKRAAERIVEVQTSQDVPIGILFDEFEALASPEAILALIAENERLSGDEQEAADLCDRLSDLLRNTAIEVRGPEEPLKRHGFHDLPSRVKTVVAERDQLKAEVEALRQDAERYRRMRTASLKQSDVLADEFDAEFDLQFDAPQGKEAQL